MKVSARRFTKIFFGLFTVVLLGIQLVPYGSNEHEADEAASEIRDGEMPLNIYTLMHPSAALTDAEKEKLAQGLEATLGPVKPGTDAGHADEDHE